MKLWEIVANLEERLSTLEDEIYPTRNRKGSALPAFLAFLGALAVVAGAIYYFGG